MISTDELEDVFRKLHLGVLIATVVLLLLCVGLGYNLHRTKIDFQHRLQELQQRVGLDNPQAGELDKDGK